MSAAGNRTVDEVHLPRGVAPAVTADAIVQQHRDALDLLRREMTVALERRRRELERALHDGAQQQLLALRMEILRVLGSGVLEGADAALGSTVDRLDRAVDDLVRLASGQLPRAIDTGNLVDSLRELAAISGASVDVHVPPALEVDEASAEVIAFVVSEALANAQQHASATRCAVTVVPTALGLRVDVVDDGRGGAAIVPGRGIDGLRTRAEALGGTLDVFSEASGTLVRLQLPHPKRSVRALDPLAPGSTEELFVAALRRALGDPEAGVWFWCPQRADAEGRGVWRDEVGAVLERNASQHGSRSVTVFQHGEPVARCTTVAERAVVARVCRDHAARLVDARERAVASTTLARLRDEHRRLALRSQSFEDALRRRLTDRPCDELQRARQCLTALDPRHRRDAAQHVANATEQLREIVRRLRVPDSATPSTSDTLMSILERTARRARVRIDLDADDVDDEAAVTVIERVAEEVMLDAAPLAELVMRVRTHRDSVTLSVSLPRLPSPVAIALLEELALSSGSTVAFRPTQDGLRMLMEVPCVS